LVCLCAGLAIGGCGGSTPDDGGDAGGLPSVITCGVYYRPRGDASTEGAVEQSVALQPAGAGTAEQTVEFGRMSFAVRSISDAGEGDAVSLSVSSSDGVVLTSVLYQLGSFDLADVAFSGGHGFTGLHYVDHEGAQLQFWCSAD
jgi:hypothetical protein